MTISAESKNTVTHKNVTLRKKKRGSHRQGAWLGISLSRQQPDSSTLWSSILRQRSAVHNCAWSTMPRKRSHKDVNEPTKAHFCQHCSQRWQPKGGGPAHRKTCVAVQAAENYQRSLEALYFNDGSFTTPVTDIRQDNTNSHSRGEEDSHLFNAETPDENSTQIMSDNNTTQAISDTISTNITAYLASLPGLDTEYILQCLHWLPRPTAITDSTRLALKFLSCTCAGDGLSKNHMKGILKFIKCLRGPDSALLPNSIETCWNTIEEVLNSFDSLTVT